MTHARMMSCRGHQSPLGAEVDRTDVGRAAIADGARREVGGIADRQGERTGPAAVAEYATDNDERWPLSEPIECDGRAVGGGDGERRSIMGRGHARMIRTSREQPLSRSFERLRDSFDAERPEMKTRHLRERHVVSAQSAVLVSRPWPSSTPRTAGFGPRTGRLLSLLRPTPDEDLQNPRRCTNTTTQFLRQTPSVRAGGGSVVTHEQLQTFARNSLDQAVNLVPGVVSNFDANGRRNESDIFVRGFGRQQVPLMVDGVRIYLPADNRLDFARFLTADIAAISDSERLCVCSRRSWCDGRCHQPGHDEAEQSLRSRRRNLRGRPRSGGLECICDRRFTTATILRAEQRGRIGSRLVVVVR